MTSVSTGSSKKNVRGRYVRSESKRSDNSLVSVGSPTPPAYAVIEDEAGNLVNRALNVVWPARPLQGRHSLKGYIDRKIHSKKELQTSSECQIQKPHGDKKLEPTKSIKSRRVQSMTKDNHLPKCILEAENIFVGVRPASSLRSMLRPSEFRLFYMRPESMGSFNEMPLKMPLMLAYMSTNGIVYKFGFTQHKLGLRTYWQLDMRGSTDVEQPIFPSLSSLLKHYVTFANYCGNGKTEVFPIEIEDE